MWKRFPRFVQDGSRGDDGLEGENPERARECIFTRKRFPEISSRGMTGWSLKVSKAFGTFRRKRFPATLSGICGGDDELERADSERARKQIRMWKWFPEISSRGDDGLESKSFESFRNF